MNAFIRLSSNCNFIPLVATLGYYNNDAVFKQNGHL